MTDAELRNLLQDCLTLWDIPGSVTAAADAMLVEAGAITCRITRGPAPTRWFITTPARTRPTPSITALLTALRRALGAEPSGRARIGAGAALGIAP